MRVAPSDEGSRISIHQNVSTVAALVLGLGGGFSLVGIIFALFVALGVLQPDALTFALVIFLGGVATAGGGWISARTWSNHQQRKLDLASDRAELIARS